MYILYILIFFTPQGCILGPKTQSTKRQNRTTTKLRMPKGPLRGKSVGYLQVQPKSWTRDYQLRIKFNEWSERVFNPWTPDLNASAPTTGPQCFRSVPPSAKSSLVSVLPASTFLAYRKGPDKQLQHLLQHPFDFIILNDVERCWTRLTAGTIQHIMKIWLNKLHKRPGIQSQIAAAVVTMDTDMATSWRDRLVRTLIPNNSPLSQIP